MTPDRYGKQDFVKSSPHFFRLIYGALLLFLVLALCGGVLIPAPLLGPADPGNPPNPAKSAWFLLWIQELVSYGTVLIYPALATGLLFLLLPWLPLHRHAWRASWLPRGQMAVNILTLAVFSLIIFLTCVAAFFRGPQWSFVMPF